MFGTASGEEAAPGLGRGVQRASRIGNANARGITPITVCVAPARRIVWPTMAGSPASADCQKSKPMRAAAGLPGRASSSTRSRPSRGGTRSSLNTDGLISAARTRRVVPFSVVTTRSSIRKPPTASNVPTSRRHVSMSPSVWAARSPVVVSCCQMATTRSPSGTGSVGWTMNWVPGTCADERCTTRETGPLAPLAEALDEESAGEYQGFAPVPEPCAREPRVLSRRAKTSSRSPVMSSR
jgi:hypothetical protein